MLKKWNFCVILFIKISCEVITPLCKVFMEVVKKERFIFQNSKSSFFAFKASTKIGHLIFLIKFCYRPLNSLLGLITKMIFLMIIISLKRVPHFMFYNQKALTSYIMNLHSNPKNTIFMFYCQIVFMTCINDEVLWETFLCVWIAHEY